MLGLGDHIGTLEPGKLGNVIVTDGNPPETQIQMTKLFILGRPMSTATKDKSPLLSAGEPDPRGLLQWAAKPSGSDTEHERV
ncbi:MAG: hypothetical protein OSA81_10335 [Longimicrobiales bacterium]|nr:hypothetical protein [Longimicrobiales bacterium]